MKINIDKINEWPDSWAGFKDDIEYGQRPIQLMRPFVEELLKSEYSYKTINNHMNNLWMLGGFTISNINEYEENRKTQSLFMG
ncbi:MAG: hypothetical protein ABH952_06380 [Candidatus Omnitrophota bacterium]